MVELWGKRTGAGFIAVCVAVLGLAFSSAATAAVSTPRIKPPAPGPEYLTRLDHARLLTVHRALKRKEFSLARAESQFITDPTAQSLGDWMYFMARDNNVDLAEAGAFLNAHPDWPAAERIQGFVEGRISENDSPDAILSFFAAREPRTGDGKIQLARALLSKGRGDEATALIRDAWINHNFSIAEERRILRVYKSRLRNEDHAARVDRLLWAIQVTNARRTFPQLSSKDRRMAEARAALLVRAATAPRLYRNLPQADQLDSGVLHAAVRYYRRTDDQNRAITLAAKAPESADALRNSKRWWTERRILMQWALKEGRFSDAYGLAAHHGGAKGTDFSDAEFVAGWIALRFLNQPQRARIHFEAMTGAVATPISLSRGYYWLGRAAAAAGDENAARAYYTSSAEHHYSYYGQLAAEELGGAALEKRFAAPIVASPADKARFASRPAVAALRMLSDLDLDYEFMVFAYHIDDELERPGEFIELAKITNGEGAPHLTVRAGKVATQRGAFAPHVAYPLVFVPDEARAFVAPEIVLGLSRQESEFNPRAYSRAGARGVMQLIPTTAQITARKEGLPYRRSALLDDPVYNMTLGSAHLSHLLDRFDGSLVMTFAAYNAGAHRASQWAEDFGDPRTGDVDPVDWVELIPFSETRNYVQRVLENVQVYRGQLNQDAIPGRLSADIERGGPRGRIATVTTPSARLAALAQSRNGVVEIADLPAQTAIHAETFREKRLASLTVQTPPPSPSLTIPNGPQAQPELNTRRGRRGGRGRAPKINQEIAPTVNNATEEEAKPMALPTEDAPRTKTENIVAPTASPAPTPPVSPPVATTAENITSPASFPAAESIPQPLAEQRADPLAALVENAIADAEERQTKAAFAEKIIEKASTRLQIVDEGDVLAAAIVRGLEQMESETAPALAETANASSNPLDCVDAASYLASNEDEAASLNARMAAQLRGEDDPCSE